MNEFILEMKNDIEKLKEDRCETMVKVKCQELIIDRMKADAMRCKAEMDTLRVEKKNLEKNLETVTAKYHQKEVALTAERDTFKRELELVRESNKKADVENGKLQVVIRDEQNKRQKLRSAYGTLNRSFNESVNGGDEMNVEMIKEAMNTFREGLIV